MTATVFAAVIAAAAQESNDSVQAENTLLQQELAQRNAELAQRDAQLAERDAELAEIERRKADKAIWGPGRFTKLSYNFASTGDGFNPVEKSKYSVSLAKGASYLFPSKAVAGILKFGFDVTWFDFTFTKYKSPVYGVDGGWTSTPEYTTDSKDEDDFDLDLGRMSLNLGALGIGPRVSVAPFAAKDNGLRYLRASLYFHYQPTVSAYAVSEDGETEFSFAYLGLWRFGGCIQYRRIGIGVEGYWGKAKFEALGLDSFVEEGFADDQPKIERKFASTRLYLSFSF